MKILVFDVSALYGHFRVPYTVTSPLTFPVPSKTALYGMIGAIIGLDKNSYLEQFQNKSCLCSIQLLKPIKKTHIAANYINTKNVQMFSRMDSQKKAPHSQVKVEYIKDLAFRFYIYLEESTLFTELENMLSEHKTAYTLSMGLSECIANFNFIGTFEAEKVKTCDQFLDVASIVPLNQIMSPNSINFVEEGRKFLKVHLPLEMKPDRELLETGDFIIESNAKSVSLKTDEIFKINELNTNILLF